MLWCTDQSILTTSGLDYDLSDSWANIAEQIFNLDPDQDPDPDQPRVQGRGEMGAPPQD
jgi:hypothetical protein